MITELERRALMGDQLAQLECTQRGIVLACPFCSGDFDAKFNGVMFKMERTNLYAHKRTGRCVLDGMIIFNLSDWNTRPAPPIGRCEECLNWCTGTQFSNRCACQVLSSLKDDGLVFTESYDFCSKFKPKE